MTTQEKESDHGSMFETEENLNSENEQDCEESAFEENIENMLRIWNRKQLLNEIKDEKLRQKLDEHREDTVYYDGKTPFSEIAKQMAPLANSVEGDDRILIKITEECKSAKQIRPNSTILFDCIGYIEFQNEPFDSTINDGKPRKLDLNEGPILFSLLKALLNLHEGERANILIHPSFAYGELGCFPVVPANAFLYYSVKIHKVWDQSELNELLDYEKAQNFVAPIEDKLAAIEDHKAIANKYLLNEDYREAVIRYKVAIRLLEQIPFEGIIKDEKLTKLMVILSQNASIAFNKLEMFLAATKYAKLALKFCPTSIKAFYNLIKAQIGLKEYQRALEWCKKANRIVPNEGNILQLQIIINQGLQEEKSKRNEIMSRMAKVFV